MSSKILIKRSTTSGAIPTTSDLDTGELGLNTVDKRLYTNNSGTIVELGTYPSSLNVTGNTDLDGTLNVDGASTLASGTVSGNWTVTGTLTVSTPSNSTDAASKGYVDTAIANVIDSAPGALDTLNELAAAINDDANFATTITNSIATKLALAGGTMTGDITLGANKITSTATPTTDDTLTRKGYVDSILGSATDAATSAAAAATSATNAANSATSASGSATTATTQATAASTSASNAATSETNAATSASSASTSATAAAGSATAAANSAAAAAVIEDNFDDAYLGAKASDPSVDNDGDALADGALYFDTTNNVMKVYDLGTTTWFQLTPTVAAQTNINTVANDISNVNTVATNISDVNTVATNATEIVAVGTDIANINTVSGSIANVNNVAANLASVNAFGETYFVAATAPSSPTEGDLWFDTTGDKMMVYNGGSWQNAGSSVNGTAARFKFVATASQTAFTGTDANGATLAYDSGYIDVYLNGVHLDPSDYTATDGSTITLASGAAAGDELYVVAFGTFTLATHYTKTEVDGLLSGIASDAITEGNSSVEVVDTGSGYITATTDGSERMRIDSSGNLLVGTTDSNDSTDGFKIKSSGQKLTVTRDGAEPLVLNRRTSDGEIIDFRKDNATVGSIGSSAGGELLYMVGGNAGGIAVTKNSNIVYPVNSAGTLTDNIEDIGSSSYRFKDLYLSGGVYLGGTGSANKLDDYEEGSYTVTFTPQTGSLNLAGAQNTISYVKIGSTVHIQGRVQISTVSSPSGDVNVSLPFAVSTSNPEFSNYAILNVAFHNVDIPSTAYDVWGFAIGGNSYFELLYSVDNSQWSRVNASGFSNSDYIVISGTYFTDS